MAADAVTQRNDCMVLQGVVVVQAERVLQQTSAKQCHKLSVGTDAVRKRTREASLSHAYAVLDKLPLLCSIAPMRSPLFCCRVLLLGESSNIDANAATERVAKAAEHLLQRMPGANGAGAGQRLPVPVRELLRVTAAGAVRLSDGELNAAAEHICRAARRQLDSAPALASVLRYCPPAKACRACCHGKETPTRIATPAKASALHHQHWPLSCVSLQWH